MSLYPSLEDMQVHKIVQAQQNAFAQQSTMMAPPPPSAPSEFVYPQLKQDSSSASPLYPGLSDFMGLELTPEMIAINMPEYNTSMMPLAMGGSAGGMIAPLSNQTIGLQRAHVTHGIRDVIVCKGPDNKVGLRVKDINNGVFITLVCKGSPAALVGYVLNDLSCIQGTLIIVKEDRK